MLDVWPSLPLLIHDSDSPIEGVDDIIAVLERSDRVAKIDLYDSALEKVVAAMQEPFPELTHLLLTSNDIAETVLPDSFLGGFAPRLQFLMLILIPFPGLPKLLLSATHLVTLHLWQLPHPGYFSPEVMVTALSTLTSLESLSLGFDSPRSRPDWASRRPPPLTRSVLPVLTTFWFRGVCEYLDDIVACIDAPRLYKLEITFFNQIVFDTPQFTQFICRTTRTPTSKEFE
jgi:hypothetical protein